MKSCVRSWNCWQLFLGQVSVGNATSSWIRYVPAAYREGEVHGLYQMLRGKTWHAGPFPHQELFQKQLVQDKDAALGQALSETLHNSRSHCPGLTGDLNKGGLHWELWVSIRPLHQLLPLCQV